jgi:hypothetical protein
MRCGKPWPAHIREKRVVVFRPLDQEPTSMLELRPGCECCDKNLPPESDEARICSFECTFCVDCATHVLGGTCPNCGGELVARPRRPASKLAKNPPSTQRVFNPACAKEHS